MPSPASTASSGPGSNHSSGAGAGTVSTVAIPQVIQQVASSYVNITALFLSAHDIWEQADELAHKGSGEAEQRGGLKSQGYYYTGMWILYSCSSACDH